MTEVLEADQATAQIPGPKPVELPREVPAQAPEAAPAKARAAERLNQGQSSRTSCLSRPVRRS